MTYITSITSSNSRPPSPDQSSLLRATSPPQSASFAAHYASSVSGNEGTNGSASPKTWDNSSAESPNLRTAAKKSSPLPAFTWAGSSNATRPLQTPSQSPSATEPAPLASAPVSQTATALVPAVLTEVLIPSVANSLTAEAQSNLSSPVPTEGCVISIIPGQSTANAAAIPALTAMSAPSSNVLATLAGVQGTSAASPTASQVTSAAPNSPPSAPGPTQPQLEPGLAQTPQPMQSLPATSFSFSPAPDASNGPPSGLLETVSTSGQISVPVVSVPLAESSIASGSNNAQTDRLATTQTSPGVAAIPLPGSPNTPTPSVMETLSSALLSSSPARKPGNAQGPTAQPLVGEALPIGDKSKTGPSSIVQAASQFSIANTASAPRDGTSVTLSGNPFSSGSSANSFPAVFSALVPPPIADSGLNLVLETNVPAEAATAKIGAGPTAISSSSDGTRQSLASGGALGKAINQAQSQNPDSTGAVTTTTAQPAVPSASGQPAAATSAIPVLVGGSANPEPAHKSDTPALPGAPDSHSPAKSEIEPRAVLPPGPVQMAQMVERAGQSEMRIGLSTSAFGSVEVHTVVHANEVGVLIGSEKGDLRSLLATELPGIVHTLQQQNLRLNHVDFQQGSAFSNHPGRDSPPRSFARSSGTHAGLPRESNRSESVGPGESSAERVGTGLSILA
jgi:Flagellar hook-length control protein FliK